MQKKRTMDSQAKDRIKGLESLIGNTALLEIKYRYKGKERIIFAKAEHSNMTGSIKDRMALHILKKATENGSLKPKSRIYEATSGNTGISISAIGKALGHSVTIFMPNWMSTERINIIRSVGATIQLVSPEEGGFKGSIAKAEEAAACHEQSFLPRQFENSDNVEAHYKTTGPEIWYQLAEIGLKPDAFVAGVGTGGTIMGVGQYLREMNPKVKLYPLEPSNSPTLSTGFKVGKHRLQGISDEFIPPIVDLQTLNEVVAVDDGDSIIMAQKLADLGLAVGISSGANFLGCVLKQDELGDQAVVVTVFSDCNKKYLSTDLLRNEPIKDGFLSNDIELLSFKGHRRVCVTCCNTDDCDMLNVCQKGLAIQKEKNSRHC